MPLAYFTRELGQPVTLRGPAEIGGPNAYRVVLGDGDSLTLSSDEPATYWVTRKTHTTTIEWIEPKVEPLPPGQALTLEPTEASRVA